MNIGGTHFLQNKKILITGNTGFIGTWLSLFLHSYGARVAGYARGKGIQNPFSKRVNDHIDVAQYYGDVTDMAMLRAVIEEVCPDIIFHFAGQAFISDSNSDPFNTIYPNAFGTLCLLDILRGHKLPCKLVVMTSDRCYMLKKGRLVYDENDEIGGSDIYSMSKAMQEQLIAMYCEKVYRNSLTACCTVRSGNIMGGGDFATSRLIPDVIRSINNNEQIFIRQPKARKAWMYIFDAISSYILISQRLFDNNDISGESFNIGPDNIPDYTTSDVVRMLVNAYGAPNLIVEPYESEITNQYDFYLANSKIKAALGWSCRISTAQAIEYTAEWYRMYHRDPDKIIDFSMEQILKYTTGIK